LTGQQIDQYLSPYLNDVMGSTSKLLGQQNEQAQSGQLGNAIRSVHLVETARVLRLRISINRISWPVPTFCRASPIKVTSPRSVPAQGQQQIGLAGAKQLADIGSTAYGEGANTASEMGALGSGAQSAGLQGAQAQIATGTVQQQTQQAQDTAQYQQFLQQQSYPFQTAQFLANIAEGTGALSGSTTTTTQPGGFFSDERLKEDMEPIGKTFDGQPIYRYKMKGDPRERIGLSAQQVEKKHPEAVGLAGGYKWVDYGQATEEAANRSHFYEGGVVPFRRQRYADGGSPGGLDSVLEAQRNMYAPHQDGSGQRNIHRLARAISWRSPKGRPRPRHRAQAKLARASGSGRMRIRGINISTSPRRSASSVFDRAESGRRSTERRNNLWAGTPATVSAAPQPGTTSYFGPRLTRAPRPHSGQRPMQGPRRPLDPPRRMPARRPHLMPDWARPIRRLQEPLRMPPPARRRAPQKEPLRVVRQKQGWGCRRSHYGRRCGRAADAAATEAAVLAAEYAATYARWQPWQPNEAAGSRVVQDLLQADT